MDRKKASDFPPAVLQLFDGYIHGMISRREFLERATRYAVGGFTGALLTAVFANTDINPAGAGASVPKQLLGLVVVIGWSAVITFLILMVCKYTTGLRVTEEEEIEGLDQSQHGETLHG